MLDRHQLKRNRKLSLISALNPNKQSLTRMENKYLYVKGQKRCPKCLIIKHISLFNSNISTKYGITDRCSSCESIRKSKYDDYNRDTINYKQREKYHTDDLFRHNKLQDRIRWRNNNIEHRYKYCREWILNNKEKVKIYDVNKQIRRGKRICKTQDGTITPNTINEMLINQNYKCVECGIDITSNYTLDHCKSLYDGGSHSIDNIQLMCMSCNRKKYTKSYRVINGERIYL